MASKQNIVVSMSPVDSAVIAGSETHYACSRVVSRLPVEGIRMGVPAGRAQLATRAVRGALHGRARGLCILHPDYQSAHLHGFARSDHQGPTFLKAVAKKEIFGVFFGSSFSMRCLHLCLFHFIIILQLEKIQRDGAGIWLLTGEDTD